MPYARYKGEASQTAGRQAVFLPSRPASWLALLAVTPSHPRALPRRGPHQRLVVLNIAATRLDAGLDRETRRLALRPHQRLVVVQGDPPSLDTSLHLHSHPPFWSCSDTVRTAPLTPLVAAHTALGRSEFPGAGKPARLPTWHHHSLRKSRATAYEAGEPLSLPAISLALP